MNWEDQEIDDVFRNADKGSVPPFDHSFWEEMEGMLPDDGKGVDPVFIGAAAKVPLPPYRAAYWKEMETMLPGRKRRIAGFWWYSAAGSLLLVGTLLLYKWNAGNPLGDEVVQRPFTAVGQPKAASFERTDQVNSENTVSSNRANQYGIPANSDADIRDTRPVEPVGFEAPRVVESPAVVSAPVASTIDPLAKLETGVSYNMALAPFKMPEVFVHEKKFYVQLSAGMGQSFIRQAPGSDLVHFYGIGAGVQKRSGSMFMSFGLGGRIDFIDNLSADITTPQGHRTSHFRQLYTVETPVLVAFTTGKNYIGGTVTPGLQLGYTGTYIAYDNTNTETKRGRSSGKMPQSKTLAMEIGVVYMRDLGSDFLLGGTCGVDVLRPIGEQFYYGENRSFPVNGAIFIRKNF